MVKADKNNYLEVHTMLVGELATFHELHLKYKQQPTFVRRQSLRKSIRTLLKIFGELWREATIGSEPRTLRTGGQPLYFEEGKVRPKYGYETSNSPRKFKLDTSGNGD